MNWEDARGDEGSLMWCLSVHVLVGVRVQKAWAKRDEEKEVRRRAIENVCACSKKKEEKKSLHVDTKPVPPLLD